MIVLGLHGAFSVNHHDASACVVIDGRPVSLCEEERYTRIKGSYGYLPDRSIRQALKVAGVTWEQVDLVVTPGVTYTGGREFWDSYLKHLFGSSKRILQVHHQIAHAASAFCGSGFEKSEVLSLDASGDGKSGVWGLKSPDFLDVQLGSFYTSVTQYCGFSDGDEYKLMGLAPYGNPIYDLPLDVSRKSRTPFGVQYSERLESLLGRRNRLPDEPLDQFYKDVAASCQLKFETELKRLVGKQKRLCFAGGCAQNVKANSILDVEELYVPPVAGDRGLSLGCAYLGALELGDSTKPILNAYLGEEYSSEQIKKELDSNGVKYQRLKDPWVNAGNEIALGKVVGWFQGRSEAGARSLGNRSILALAEGVETRDRVNSRIKFREEFRPFAPAVQKEHCERYFDGGTQYMTGAFKARSDLPAVVHVDGTSRVQTVRHSDNPKFYELISQVGRNGKNPVVLNTSFNLKGQPIVESPRDALMTFFGCGLDTLYLGDYYISK